MTSKDMTRAAKEIQQDSLQSTSRAKQAIMTTIQIGNETSEVLRQQTEQITNVSKTVDEIESNFKRADKQLRGIMRHVHHGTCATMMPSCWGKRGQLWRSPAFPNFVYFTSLAWRQ